MTASGHGKASFNIKNPYENGKMVAFKVKTNMISRYSVSPSTQILKCGEDITISCTCARRERGVLARAVGEPRLWWPWQGSAPRRVLEVALLRASFHRPPSPVIPLCLYHKTAYMTMGFCAMPPAAGEDVRETVGADCNA